MTKRTGSDRRIKELIAVITTFLIAVFVIGYAILPLIEEITLGAYNSAQTTQIAMLIALIPAVFVLAIIIYYLRSQGMVDF